MQPLVGWPVTAAGAVLVALAPRDISHTLWRPTGRGAISRLVMAAVWRAGRRGRRQGPTAGGLLSGPLAMVLVVSTWTSTVLIGGALGRGSGSAGDPPTGWLRARACAPGEDRRVFERVHAQDPDELRLAVLQPA